MIYLTTVICFYMEFIVQDNDMIICPCTITTYFQSNHVLKTQQTQYRNIICDDIHSLTINVFGELTKI